ncbi:hypothetical protein, partial [Achromobacter dolens]|uniref:hypothetical protein n=1 Tax=Achromobacter dolens TaxID=1287738 RepID=UPI0031D71942
INTSVNHIENLYWFGADHYQGRSRAESDLARPARNIAKIGANPNAVNWGRGKNTPPPARTVRPMARAGIASNPYKM